MTCTAYHLELHAALVLGDLLPHLPYANVLHADLFVRVLTMHNSQGHVDLTSAQSPLVNAQTRVTQRW